MTYTAFPSYGPPTREAVDAELSRLGRDAARIGEALVELTDHPAYKMLDSAPLSGDTAQRWQRAAARVAALWDNYTAYQDVLNRAGEIRNRRPAKPRPEDLLAVADLLRGRSITLSTKAVALSERTLLGPATVTETSTLAESVARMDADYQAAADFVSEAETAWNSLFAQVDPLQDRLKQVIAAVREVGDRTLATSVAAVADDQAALRREVFADPIGLSSPRSDFTQRVARVTGELEAVAATATGAADLRADFNRRAEHLARLIDRIEEVEAGQRAAGAEARAKIAVAALPEPTNQAPVLRERLAGLSELRERGRWRALADRAGELETDLAAALDLANRTLQAAAGLLERREELRGRLAAYRVRAARFGAAEDPRLEAYYQAAREPLWSQPCDLGAATRALSAYQKAVLALDAAGPGGRGNA